MSRSFTGRCCSYGAVLAIYYNAVTAGPVKSRNADSSDLVAPFSFAPSGDWEGIDGSWSSFAVRVGTPSQLSKLFVSWASHQTWVVLPQGCDAASDYSACEGNRGGIFNLSASSTWSDIGLFVLDVDTQLGYNGNAEFGYDTLGLGDSSDAGVTLNHTTIGAFAVEDFYLGLLGLNPQASNFTSSQAISPSIMTLLKERNAIPSISFGYTAGAHYRQSGVLGSLTLGGYDSARIVENNVQFDLSSNAGSNTVVAVTSISTESQVQSNPIPVGLLPSTIAVSLDASVPQIWLPVEVCKAFENAFGLVYNATTNLYLVNDTLHTSLLQRNPNITFELAPIGDEQNTISITLPYAAFDLDIQPPYPGISENSTYFPLRRAVNASQYTFGRTFFQEAYISVDYESNVFNVSSIAWSTAAQQKLVTIPPSSSTTPPSTKSSSGLSTGEIAGIATGGVAGIVLLVLTATFIRYICTGRHRKQQTKRLLESDSDSTPQVSEKTGSLSPETDIVAPVKAITDTATSTRRSSNRFDKRAALPSISEYGGTKGSGGTPSTTRSVSIHRASGALPSRRSSIPNLAESPSSGSNDSDPSRGRTPYRAPNAEAERIARNRATTLSALVAKTQSTEHASGEPAPVYEMPGDAPPRRYSVNGTEIEPEQRMVRGSNTASATAEDNTPFSRPDSIEVARLRTSQHSITDETEEPKSTDVSSEECPVSPVSPVAERPSRPSWVRSFSFEE